MIRAMRIFRRDESGAALVEFAFILPVMLLFFAIMIEGSRTFWAYQTTVAGVRDATRFVARAETSDICTNGANIARWTNRIEDIVRQSATNENLFPASVNVASVTPDLHCETGTYSQSIVPLITVTAQLEIEYPFSGIFEFFNLSLPSAQTKVSDTGRIFGT